MGLNCTVVEDALDDTWKRASSDGAVLLVVALVFLGTLLLAAGARLVKPVLCVGGLAAAGIGTFASLSVAPCAVRAAVATAAALAAAGIVLCSLALGVSAAAVATAAGGVHVVYRSLPLPSSPFSLFGADGVQLLTTAGGGAAGLVFACCYDRALLRLASIGLAAAAFGGAAYVVDDTAPPIVYPCVGIGVSAIGVAVRSWSTRTDVTDG